MKFIFNSIKTTQAASLMFRHSKGNISLRKLNKLLYLADRASLKRTGCPITGDTFVNTLDGPALTTGCSWARTDMDDDELSRYSVGLLESLCDQYQDYDDPKMIALLQSLPEWEKPLTIPTPLNYSWVLIKMGVSLGHLADYESLNAGPQALEALMNPEK